MKMINDYSTHAYVWDWDGYDNTPEYEYWCQCAAKYGRRVLTPMCALGSAGAYMAEHGFEVLGFDLTEEMVVEGKRRFGNISNLELVVANVCDFEFAEREFDFVFVKDQDLHLLPDLNAVKQALDCLHKALRQGGGLVLELTLPGKESIHTPKQIFHPRVPNFTDKKIWKESECHYDATEKRNYINQMVFVEEERKLTQFEYSVCLQYFEREEILDVLGECGFQVVSECVDRAGTVWNGETGFWRVEVAKR